MPVVLAPVKPLMNKKDFQMAAITGLSGSSGSDLMRGATEEFKNQGNSEDKDLDAPFIQFIVSTVENQT